MRTAFVSGGTSEIGSAIVRALREICDEVHFGYNTSSNAAAELARIGGVFAHQTDYCGEWSVPDLDIDVLVNNAGINRSGCPAHATDRLEILETFEVNVLAAHQMIAAFGPGMCERGWGRIVNINSLYGLVCPANRLSYSISKFALRALTGTYATEFAGRGVTVNDVCPGPVPTAMLTSMGQQAVDQQRFRSIDAYMQTVADEVPTGRLVQPEEVAGVVAFLASDAAGSCTGMTMPVDGGMSVIR